MSNEWIDEVIRDIAEMDDRDSPPEWPEAMLVTADELKEIITRHAPIPVVSLSDAALRKITSVKIERLPECKAVEAQITCTFTRPEGL